VNNCCRDGWHKLSLSVTVINKLFCVLFRLCTVNASSTLCPVVASITFQFAEFFSANFHATLLLPGLPLFL